MSDETGEAIDARARLVEWALGEVGEQNPHKYYRICAPQFADKPGTERTISWCGIFCLAGLRTLNLCDWEWVTGKGFVYRLRYTAFADQGDIAVFRKGANGRDLWHHAIVARPTKNGYVETVDGNVLISPREGVAERKRPLDSNVTFYSIASLLRD